MGRKVANLGLMRLLEVQVFKFLRGGGLINGEELIRKVN